MSLQCISERERKTSLPQTSANYWECVCVCVFEDDDGPSGFIYRTAEPPLLRVPLPVPFHLPFELFCSPALCGQESELEVCREQKLKRKQRSSLCFCR